MLSKVYDYISQRVIENIKTQICEMEKDPTKKFQWVRPWGLIGKPFNDKTGFYYRGINLLLLMRGGAYLSKKQIEERKLKIKKGAKSEMVVFWTVKKYSMKDDKSSESEDQDAELESNMADSNESEEEGNTKIKKQFILKYYNVYHESDIEGFTRKHHVDEKEEFESRPIESLEMEQKLDMVMDCLNRYYTKDHLKVSVIKSNSAYYSPTEDRIVCPIRDQFNSTSEFLSTLTHESIHSTGHESRLNRDLSASSMKAKSYSKEELVAEIGACILLALFGVEEEDTTRNSLAYIKGWLDRLKSEPSYVITYASQNAQKAVDYICKSYFDKDEESTVEADSVISFE